MADNPKYASSVNAPSEPPGRNHSGLSIDAVIKQGEYFRLLTTWMAVNKVDGKIVLRRELLEEIFKEYKTIVGQTFAYIQDFHRSKFLRVVPIPLPSWKVKNQTNDPAAYPVSIQPIKRWWKARTLECLSSRSVMSARPFRLGP